mmetsp:Transcript_9902/g.19003  ORF Transcript_9902/g.19003 Transcript_9902/m.19003 type:complete len:249 (+) Transcript_9902:1539-2285(+)
MRNGNQVIITVAIHVPVGNVVSLDTNVDGMILPDVSFSINIFVPVNVSIKKGSRCDIHVTIAIEINGSDTENEIGIIIDESLGKISLSIVAPQRDVIVSVGSHNQVLVAIVVDINGDERVGPRGFWSGRNDDLGWKMPSSIVGIPCNGIVIFGRRSQIDPTISIQISCHNSSCSHGVVINDFLDLTELAFIHILEDRNGIVPRRCCNDIGIAIMIHICNGHALPFVDSIRNQVRSELSRAIVFEPSQG